MVEVKDAVIFDREKDYVADEVSLINFVVKDYSDPIAPKPNEYAVLEYDQATEALIEGIRRQRSEEANGQGLKGKIKGAYINLIVENCELERKNQRDEVIEKRTKELETEIAEGLKNLKKLSLLKTTIDDGILIQDFAI